MLHNNFIFIVNLCARNINIKFNNQTLNKMKKVILFATVSAFAVSTMFAQQSGGTPPKKEEKPKTENAVKDTTKKAEKAPVKKVPAKKTEGEKKETKK